MSGLPPTGRRTQASLARSTTDIVPEYNPSHPEEMALSIDRKISLMRAQSTDPALDRNRSVQERQQYMPEAPASQAYNGGPGDARRSSGGGVEWLPYSSTKEKLESWITPDTNDASDKRNLLRRMSKEEQY